jgi:ribonuclease P protein component
MAEPCLPVETSEPAKGHPLADFSALPVLRKRSQFLAAARARRVNTPGFLIQIRKRPDGEASGIRVGFTCSKKVGNAVARNRAKRRLREIARLTLRAHGCDGYDYVLIGKSGITALRDLEKMRADLRDVLHQAHGA